MPELFKQLKISNWRQFREVDISFHERLTILTGSNGAGKTTVLNLLSRHFGWQGLVVSTPRRRAGGTTFSPDYWTEEDLADFETWLEERKSGADEPPKVTSPQSGEQEIGTLTYGHGASARLCPPLEAALVEARKDFGKELEKTRQALQKSEERCDANEKRALLEIDRERTNGLRLQKELKVAQEQLQGIHVKLARDIALLQAELGETKLKLGSSEGILQEMRSRNLRLEEQLQAARSSAEVARTQETVAKKEIDAARTQEGIVKRELEICRAEIAELRTQLKTIDPANQQSKVE